MAAALAWIAVVGIAGQLIGPGLARWLPFYASEWLDRASLTPGRRVAERGGGLVLLGYALAFAAAAVLITLKRNVGLGTPCSGTATERENLREHLIRTAAQLLDEHSALATDVERALLTCFEETDVLPQALLVSAVMSEVPRMPEPAGTGTLALTFLIDERLGVVPALAGLMPQPGVLRRFPTMAVPAVTRPSRRPRGMRGPRRRAREPRSLPGNPAPLPAG